MLLYYKKEKAKMAHPNLIYLLYFTPTFILVHYFLCVIIVICCFYIKNLIFIMNSKNYKVIIIKKTYSVS